MESNKQLKIIIMGPQGSGKGTQARLLAEKYNLIRITPGQIFRKNIEKKTEMGLKIEKLLDQGLLAPNDITNQLMKEEVEKTGEQGFILDGYPRNEIQLKEMNKFVKPTHVLLINIPEEESIRRISGRRICEECGEDFNIYTKPPKTEDVCDKCGSKLIQRHDDHPDGVKQRLEIYHKDTEPLLSYFKEQGILSEIDGSGGVEEVFVEVDKYIK